MSLRVRREGLGLTQKEVAERAGTSSAYYNQIENGLRQLPNAELRRELSRVLGIRHVDFLVETGILDDWEVPGFTPDGPTIDSDQSVVLTLLQEIDLTRDQRGTLLAGILRQWAEQDRQRSTLRTLAPDETG